LSFRGSAAGDELPAPPLRRLAISSRASVAVTDIQTVPATPLM